MTMRRTSPTRLPDNGMGAPSNGHCDMPTGPPQSLLDRLRLVLTATERLAVTLQHVRGIVTPACPTEGHDPEAVPSTPDTLPDLLGDVEASLRHAASLADVIALAVGTNGPGD
jgi:hypothetical protein